MAATSIARLLNADALRQVDCAGMAARATDAVRNAKFPVRYSLQSVKLRPVEQDPTLVSLTLRASGEVRIVHGTREIFDAVRKAVAADEKKQAKEEEEKKEGEGEEKKEEEGKEKKDEKKEEDAPKDEGEKKEEGKAEEKTDEEKPKEEKKEGEEDKAKEELQQHKEKEAENNEKNGLWKISLQPSGGEGEEMSDKDKLLALCKILEGLTRAGWEVLTTGELTVTSGCELFTWILKKSTTPLVDAEVAAVAVAPEELKVEVLGRQPQVNNVLKQAIENVDPGNEEKKKKDGEAETEARQQKSAATMDDPDCPSSFDLHQGYKGGDDGAVLASKLVLELSHLLFCRQWKLVATAPMPSSKHEVLFFCRDSRILPALGQESFAMVELQKPDKLRLHRVSEDAEKDIRAAIVEHWPAGLESKEAEETLGGARQYRLLEDPWTRSRRNDGTKRPMVAAQILASRVLLVLNRRELNLYARVCLRRGEPDQVTLLMFRQSNVAYTETLTIQPTGLNRLAIIGASEEDLEAIRKCLKSRWPYPTTRDAVVEEGPLEEDAAAEEVKGKKTAAEEGGEKEEKGAKEEKGEKEGGDTKEEEQKEEKKAEEEEEKKEKENEDAAKEGEKMEVGNNKTLWQFKVKRYPWAVSYGNKHLDKLVDAVKVASSEVRQIPPIPEPGNMDAESAKSVLAFLLKDLGELGWRLQTSADVCSSKVLYPRTRLPERRSDAHALFLLR